MYGLVVGERVGSGATTGAFVGCEGACSQRNGKKMIENNN